MKSSELSEETIPSAEINGTSYESQADIHWDEANFFFFFQKTKNQTTKNKQMSFFKSTNIQFSILEQLLKYKACKSENRCASLNRAVRLSTKR
jgi:hypothetical protein